MCLGTGARPITRRCVVLADLSISWEVLLTSRTAAARWRKRGLLVLGALVTAVAGQSTWMFVQAVV